MSIKERLEGKYCSPYEDEELENIHGGGFNKYKIFNLLALDKYKTIEVRCHEGSVDTKVIYNWCLYLIDIAYNKKHSNEINVYIEKRKKICA